MLSSTSRMRPFVLLIISRVLGECEIERGTRARAGLSPDAAAVAADDAVHGGQADAGALEFGRGVQPLEGLEKLVGEGHVESGAVVADVEDPRAAIGRRADPHPGFGLPGSELP